MDAQECDRGAKKTTRDKFPEPKGWALNWGVHDGVSGSAPKTGARRSREVKNKFPEPKSWAARWDGTVLSDLQGGQNQPGPAGKNRRD